MILVTCGESILRTGKHFLRPLPFDEFPVLKFRGSLHVHWTTFSLITSSMTGLAMQLAAKSAANNVILLGLYCFSRRTHGRMMDGTSGVRLKMAGSQILKTPSRTSVVVITSAKNASAYPRVKET